MTDDVTQSFGIGDESDSMSTDTTDQAVSESTEDFEEEAAAGSAADVSTLDMAVGIPTDEMFEGSLPVLKDVGHPLVPDVGTYLKRPMMDHEMTDLELISWVLSNPNYSLLLIGETGTGKDYSVMKVCSETHRVPVRVNFGIGTTFEDLVGMFQPTENSDDDVVARVQQMRKKHDLSMGQAIELVTNASNNFEWRDGLLTWCVKKGGMFIADEVNAAGGDATMPLHGVVEEEGKRYLNLKEKGEVLTDLPVTDEEIAEHGSAHAARVAKWDPEAHEGEYIHPEFKFVATMNPPKYAGSKELNNAFKQRFYSVPMDYLEARAEESLLLQSGAFDSNDDADVYAVKQIVSVANKLRDSYRGGDVATPIGHRLTMQIAQLSEKVPPKKATEFILVSNAIEEDKAKIRKLVSSTKFEQ